MHSRIRKSLLKKLFAAYLLANIGNVKTSSFEVVPRRYRALLHCC
jgi:hypothetical protein